MKGNEPIIVELPKLPDVEIPLLNTNSFNVGAYLLSYVENALKVPISDEYSSLCNQLDELRENMRNQKELTPDNIQLYVNYFTLLPGLTNHLDVTSNGVNLQFSWESVIFNLVDADLVFFGFNAIIGLLKCITHISIKSRNDIQAVINCLKPCKAIYEKISTLYQDSFQTVLKSSTLDVIPKYIDAFWNYAILNNTVLSNVSKIVQGQVSNAYSSRLELLEPPQKDLSTFYKVLAYAKMFEGYKNESPKNVSIDKKYGIAIAYGTLGLSLCPKPQKPEKRAKNPPAPSELQILLEPLRAQLEAAVEFLKDENGRLYHQVPPKEVEIPSIKLDKFNEFKWEPTVQPISFDASIAKVASSQFQDKVNLIRQRISDANNKIAHIRSIYPSEKEHEIDAKVSTLYAKRTLCLEEQKKLSGMFQGRAGAKHPDLQQKFFEMQRYISRAAESDLYYETMLAKSKSTIQNLRSIIDYLNPIQVRLQELYQSFESCAQNAGQGINSPDLNQVIAANQKFTKDYDFISTQLQNLDLQIDDNFNQVNQLSQNNIQQFNADLEKVGEGLDNGIKCYTDLCTNFTAMGSRLIS